MGKNHGFNFLTSIRGITSDRAFEICDHLGPSTLSNTVSAPHKLLSVPSVKHKLVNTIVHEVSRIELFEKDPDRPSPRGEAEIWEGYVRSVIASKEGHLVFEFGDTGWTIICFGAYAKEIGVGDKVRVSGYRDYNAPFGLCLEIGDITKLENDMESVDTMIRYAKVITLGDFLKSKNLKISQTFYFKV